MMKERQRYLAAIVLVLLHFLLVFPLIDIPEIGGSSEAREAHVIKAIVSSGDWILPARNGLIPSKPPLYHWLGASLAKAGLGPLHAARTASTIFGSLVLLLTFFLAGIGSRVQVLSAHCSRGSPSAMSLDDLKIGSGFFAVVVLTTLLLFEHMFGEARVDMAFTLFATLALYCLLSFVEKSKGQSGGLCQPTWQVPAFFSACGLAVLSRGPGAVPFLVAMTFCVLFWLEGWRYAVKFLLRPRWSWLLCIGLALPWYVLAFEHSGEAFILKQISFETLERITGSEAIKNEPAWFYLVSSTVRTLPWLPFFVLFAIREYWAIHKLELVLSSQEIFRRRLKLAPVVWFVSGLVIVSLVSGKRHSYLLPLLPAFAAYCGNCFQQWIISGSSRARLIWRGVVSHSYLVPAVFAVLFIFIIEVVKFPLPNRFINLIGLQSWLLPNVLIVQTVLSLTLSFCLLSTRLSNRQSRTVITWLIVIFLFNAGIYLATSVRSHLKGFETMAAMIADEIGTRRAGVIRTERQEFFDPVLFYLPHEIERIDPSKLKEQVSRKSVEIFMATKEWYGSHSMPCQINNSKEFVPAFSRARGKNDNSIVLFSCAS